MDQRGQFLLLHIHDLSRDARAPGIPTTWHRVRREGRGPCADEGRDGPPGVGAPAGPRETILARSRPHACGLLSRAVHLFLQPDGGRQDDVSEIPSLLPVEGDYGGVAISPTLPGLVAATRADRARPGMGRLAPPEILSGV